MCCIKEIDRKLVKEKWHLAWRSPDENIWHYYKKGIRLVIYDGEENPYSHYQFWIEARDEDRGILKISLHNSRVFSDLKKAHTFARWFERYNGHDGR